MKIMYETDPLVCPDCNKKTDIVSSIHTPDVVLKILNHVEYLDQDQNWHCGGRDPPVETG